VLTVLLTLACQSNEAGTRQSVTNPDVPSDQATESRPGSQSAPDGNAMPGESTAERVEPEQLSVSRTLIRASIDLRGFRPSVAEIERVREDETALDPLLDSYVHVPGFGDVVADLMARALRVRYEDYPVPGVEEDATDGYIASVPEEPLMLIRHMANDQALGVSVRDLGATLLHMADIDPSQALPGARVIRSILSS